jgi:hypothetical protein
MNTPLTYKEQAAFSLFIVMLIPTCLLFGIGLIPLLAICVGIFHVNAGKDFGYMETAFKVVQYYTGIIVTWLVAYQIYELVDGRGLDDKLVISNIVATLYLFVFNYAVVAPLRKHQTWVANQGIFLNKELTKTSRKSPWISVGKTALIADELLKLNNLKEANLITVDEFNTLRDKLLR